MRTRVPWKFAANPFVVMTDITIALAFVMFGYYLANAATAQQLRERIERYEADRDRKLVQVANRVADAVAEALGPGYVVDRYQEVVGEGIQRAKVSEKRASVIAAVGRPGEVPFLQIDRNETLMRLRLYGMEFEPGRPELRNPQEVGAVLRAVVDNVSEALIGTSYLYVHGIASESDGPDERACLAASRSFADLVLGELKRLGLIVTRNLSEKEKEKAKEAMPASLKAISEQYQGDETVVWLDGRLRVHPSFAIAYGTGTMLYVDPERTTVRDGSRRRTVRVSPRGRADLVFFFRTPNLKNLNL